MLNIAWLEEFFTTLIDFVSNRTVAWDLIRVGRVKREFHLVVPVLNRGLPATLFHFSQTDMLTRIT